MCPGLPQNAGFPPRLPGLVYGNYDKIQASIWKKKLKCVTVVLFALGAGHFNVLFSLAFFEILLLTRLGRFPTHEDSVTVACCSFLFSQWEKRYLVEMLANALATFCILSYQPSVVITVLNDDL